MHSKKSKTLTDLSQLSEIDSIALQHGPFVESVRSNRAEDREKGEGKTMFSVPVTNRLCTE